MALVTPWFLELPFSKEITAKDSHYWVEVFYDNSWHKLFYTGWNFKGLWFMVDPNDSDSEFLMDEPFFTLYKKELKVRMPDIADKIYERGQLWTKGINTLSFLKEN